MGQASVDHVLLEPGDKVMVAVSGGKDSHAMLHLLRLLQQRAPFRFELVAVNVDQGQPGFPKEVLPAYFEREGYDWEVVTEDTYSIVKAKIPEGNTYCSLCSRLRRGILYTTARRMGATKIALGHHRDDAIATVLLNLFYSGQLKSMPPRLLSDDGSNVVIRPLIYCAEEDLARLAELRQFPVLPCNLCSSQEELKRRKMNDLVSELHRENANVRSNVLAALGNVRPTHLLDRELLRAWNAAGHGPAREEPDNPPQGLLTPRSLLRGPDSVGEVES
jgi:tRNA 2-thiocytidine biosynthesis protein TtcA